MTLPLAIAAQRLWRERPQETVLAGSVALVGLAAVAGSVLSSATLPALPGTSAEAALPAPPPLLIRKLAPEQAAAINAAIPVVEGPNPAAKPFALGKAEEVFRARALECLTSAIYYEAATEPLDGQRAVAQVVLNRVRHPAFPASVCGVVYQGSTRNTGCQFSFTCDGSLARRPNSAIWQRARELADAALKGFVFAPVGNATHYHANYVVPYWAPSLAKNAVLGAHIFYRWAGGWGRPPAFTQRYSRVEPNVEALRSAAMLAEQREREAALTGEAAEAEAIAEIPGAEELKLTPSMRGDERVAIRFNLAARKAAEEAPRVEYIQKVEASDNLRWSLTGDQVAADEKPLGAPKPKPTTGAAGAAGAVAAGAAAGSGGAAPQ